MFKVAPGSTPVLREDTMEALIGLGILLAIRVINLWGSMYFNTNMN